MAEPITNSGFMSLEQIQAGLTDRRLYIVADATGLSYPTVNKLAKGDIENYSLDTIRRVTAYLKGD